MKKSMLYIGLIWFLLQSCGDKGPTGVMPLDKRIVIKTLVTENEMTQDPNDFVIFLRWSFNPKTFDSTYKHLRLRFPECGLNLYRKDPKTTKYHHLSKFDLPSTKLELINKVLKIPDTELQDRLLYSPTELADEGENLLKTIIASQEGKIDSLPTDPTKLLILASLNPGMAQILGLLYADTVSVNPNDTLTYKLVGAWNWGLGCIIGYEDSLSERVKVIPDLPLSSPVWADDAFRDTALMQLREIKFSQKEQQVTNYWDDPLGVKRNPPAMRSEKPVVEIRWAKSSGDYIGYHIDRWTESEYLAGETPKRINVFPKLLIEIDLKNYHAELDQEIISENLKEEFEDLGIYLSQETKVWIEKRGYSWYLDDEDNKETYLLKKDQNDLKIYQLSPFLILSRVSSQEEKPERYLDGYMLKAEDTYVYQIIAVDIFGRESTASDIRKITLSPIDFPPIPPQQVCLESYDPVSGAILSDSCPQKKGNTMIWISPADLKQKQGTQNIGIRLKWQWSKDQQAWFKAKYFKIYQDTLVSGVKGKLVEPDLKIKPNSETYDRKFIISTKHPTTNKKKPARYYYFCVTTVSLNIDDDNDGKRDEDRVNGIDDDGDGKIDEDDVLSESNPSIPVMAYVVDKVPPKMRAAPCQQGSWVKITIDPQQSPDWEGKLGVHLDWTQFAKKLRDEDNIDDIDGYHIYRAIDIDENNPDKANFVRLNRKLIESTIYLDRIESTAQNKFYYRLQVVDEAGNISKKSDISCAGVLPDKVPPTLPVIIAVSGGNEQITLKWEQSSSPDVDGYFVYRGSSRAKVEAYKQNKKNRLNSTPITNSQYISNKKKKVFIYLDTAKEIEAGKDYYYIVEAVDKNGNQSFSLPAAGCSYDINPPAAPTQLKADVKFASPLIIQNENSLFQMTHITPQRVCAGDSFLLKVQIKPKVTRIEHITVSEDPRGPIQPIRKLSEEWHNPIKDSILVFDCHLKVADGAATGIYKILGTGEAVHYGNIQKLKMESEVEVIDAGSGKYFVELNWKLPEDSSRAAIWRCEADTCDGNNGRWKMIAPLLPVNNESFKDIKVYLGYTYNYKIQAYDKIGNKGKFSKQLKVKIE